MTDENKLIQAIPLLIVRAYHILCFRQGFCCIV